MDGKTEGWMDGWNEQWKNGGGDINQTTFPIRQQHRPWNGGGCAQRRDNERESGNENIVIIHREMFTGLISFDNDTEERVHFWQTWTTQSFIAKPILGLPYFLRLYLFSGSAQLVHIPAIDIRRTGMTLNSNCCRFTDETWLPWPDTRQRLWAAFVIFGNSVQIDRSIDPWWTGGNDDQAHNSTAFPACLPV